ncbi:MAG: pyridoxal-phosphate dependent enzyme [Spirochaetes bacterium]|nr:MAG: pyridoxal-phosphate dependent enzyme [Spirochaetota bacterium]
MKENTIVTPRCEPPHLLFHRYPALIKTVPHINLGTYPTPVERLEHLGHDSLWIKREDLSSPLYGGNKVRKLEYTLAEALRDNRKKVVTMGGIGTNHGLATAIFCKKLGLSARLLLFPQPVTHHVKQNMLLFQKFGAEMVYYKTMIGAGAALYTSQRLKNPGAYFLFAGGSSPSGTIGVVNAMFELREQVDAGLIPEPDYIFCPLGSNGTMAGLSLGGLLAGLKSRVIGVRVTLDHAGPIQIANPSTVTGLMKQTLSLMRRRSAEVPAVRLPEPQVINSYLGDGYGCPTAACRDAIALVKDREGVVLDPTYTAKTFAALLDFLKSPGHSGETILYWHTYNSVDHSALAATVDYHDLPRSLHWAFETNEAKV